LHALRGRQGCLDGDGRRGEIKRRFIDKHRRQFADQLAKLLRLGLFATEQTELVMSKRVRRDKNIV